MGSIIIPILQKRKLRSKWKFLAQSSILGKWQWVLHCSAGPRPMLFTMRPVSFRGWGPSVSHQPPGCGLLHLEQCQAYHGPGASYPEGPFSGLRGLAGQECLAIPSTGRGSQGGLGVPSEPYIKRCSREASRGRVLSTL